MKRLFKSRPRVATAVVVATALLLYLAGLKLLLVPVLLACLAAYVPFPRLFRSVFARVVVSGFLLYGLLLVAMLVQWVALPKSGFRAIAIIVCILTIIVVYVTARLRRPGQAPIIDRTDLAGIVVALFFLVPFAVGAGLTHRDTLGIARFGGVQSVDGTTHFSILNEVSATQHLEYKGGPFYPKGYHLDTAFVLDSFSLNPTKQRWTTNVRIFIAQYVVMGAVTAYILLYAARLFTDLATEAKRRISSMWLALTLGLPLSLIYLLSFAYQGFINYSYAVAAFAIALVYLCAAMHGEGAANLVRRRLYLVGYLLLVLSVSWSWTLLMPPVVLIALAALMPDTTNKQTIIRSLRTAFSRENIIVLFAFFLQLTPFIMQLGYSSGSASGNGDFFNALGAIRTFHYGLVIAGMALVIFVALYRGLSDELRRFATNIFVPLFLFVAFLALLQYFQAGELRYYTIKSAYLLEIILLLLAAALLLRAFVSAKIGWLQSRTLPIILLLFGSVLLVGLSGSPLKDVRELLRSRSGFEYPAFYMSDMSAVVRLYEKQGQAFGGNVAVVHYDSGSGNLSGDMMIPGWAGAMEYHSRFINERTCFNGLYGLAMYQEVNKEQQQDFKNELLACAGLSRQHGHTFFVVTDAASAPHLRELFGNAVKLVY